MDNKKQFIFILGPTGAGKTQLSLDLADNLQSPIVNCDSVQVYKHVDIGTAKPSFLERQKVPHFLFDFVEPPKKYNAADYIGDVQKFLKSENPSRCLFVGGSGFYVQALLKGLYPESKTTVELRSEIETWIEKDGYKALYKWIQDKDAVFAKTISENDHYRIRRCVEVMKSQNILMSDLKKQMKEMSCSPLPPHNSLQVGLEIERDSLRDRIEKRTQIMLEQGFVSEVEALLEKNWGGWSPMQSVGYKEIQLYLQGEILEKNLKQRIVTSTMQLAKKQMTWFRRDKTIKWFKTSENSEALDFVLDWSKKNSP